MARNVLKKTTTMKVTTSFKQMITFLPTAVVFQLTVFRIVRVFVRYNGGAASLATLADYTTGVL